MREVRQPRQAPIHQELELKAMVPDPAALRTRLSASGAMLRFTGRMIDLRYDRGGELATRDEVLRVRTLHPSGGGAETILAWKGPATRSPEGYKLREEIELPVAPSGPHPGGLLGALGYRPVHAIERDVELYLLGDATVRLETYPRMDVLVEVEGEPEAIERAIVASGLPRGAFTAEPLADFVRRYEERSGHAAVLAVAPLPLAVAGAG
jgi:adenylate cyclase class IV